MHGPDRRCAISSDSFQRVAPGSAYGFSQAKTPSWQDYQRETGNGWADRDDFDDAIDFMQWYINKSHRVNGVAEIGCLPPISELPRGLDGLPEGHLSQQKVAVESRSSKSMTGQSATVPSTNVAKRIWIAAGSGVCCSLGVATDPIGTRNTRLAKPRVSRCHLAKFPV